MSFCIHDSTQFLQPTPNTKTHAHKVTLNGSFDATWCKDVPFGGFCLKYSPIPNSPKFRKFALQEPVFAPNMHKSWYKCHRHFQSNKRQSIEWECELLSSPCMKMVLCILSRGLMYHSVQQNSLSLRHLVTVGSLVTLSSITGCPVSGSVITLLSKYAQYVPFNTRPSIPAQLHCSTLHNTHCCCIVNSQQ